MMAVNVFMKPSVVMIDDDDVQWAITQERKGNLGLYMAPHMKRIIGKDAMFCQISTQHGMIDCEKSLDRHHVAGAEQIGLCSLTCQSLKCKVNGKDSSKCKVH